MDALTLQGKGFPSLWYFLAVLWEHLSKGAPTAEVKGACWGSESDDDPAAAVLCEHEPEPLGTSWRPVGTLGAIPALLGCWRRQVQAGWGAVAAAPVADLPPPSVTRPECSEWGRAPPERMPRGEALSQPWRGSDALRAPASLSPEPTDLPFTAAFSGRLSCRHDSELGVQTQRAVFLGCDCL